MNVEKTIRQYLPQIIHLSLATSSNNSPWVCEVHFAYDDDLNFYFRSLTSRRHSTEIAQNSKVAGNIVTQHFLGQPVRAIYFEGDARLLEPGKEQKRAFECLKARLHAGDEIFEEAKREDGHQFYKISVDTFYLFDSYEADGQKFELKWSGGKK